jgi:hypothetical protein
MDNGEQEPTADAGNGDRAHQIVAQVIRHIREGEDGLAARYVFPDNGVIFELMMNASEAEKKYKFYFFDNILVASAYTPEADSFLIEAAKRAGYQLAIEDAD